ncbi:MAG: CoA ester lyase, partial [Hyphomonadaceae bacterium]|nr:CoA ester lyase [Hyphomonadaceae bacterium]
MMGRHPRAFYSQLAIGAPAPARERAPRLERMIHFLPPHLEKVRAKAGELAAQVDVLLANLEDAIPADQKEAARAGAAAMARETAFGACGFWVRINALNSPWHLDDVLTLVGEAGDKLDVLMIPKVEGPWDIHYMDQLLALLEARHRLKRPIARHAILE